MDEENGLLYIRARYYSTKRGRFITKDPTTGKDGDSQSLNRYIYALNNPVRLIDISGLSAQEANGQKPTLATSDGSLFHNYLVSPTTSGLSTQTAGSTPQYVLNSGQSGAYLRGGISEGAQQAAQYGIEYVTKGIVNNNGFNSLGSIAFGVEQGAGPLLSGVVSAYGAYSDTVAHPDRNNYEVLARFNIDLTTDSVVGGLGVAAVAGAAIIGAPVIVGVGAVIAIGVVADVYHEQIQDAVYNTESWIGNGIVNLF
jgi:RHS repeat-associated protein